MITLRPYQEQILDETRALLRVHRSVLICAPPGSGKGSLIAYMVHRAVSKGKRVIFMVRGRELVRDMSERVTKLGVEHGVLMGGRKRERWHPVQVASINTVQRMNPRPLADLIILDEARQFSNPTGREVLASYPATSKIIGADGTPALINGQGLGVSCGGIFESIVMGPNEQELIDLGFLVPSVPIGAESLPDVSGVGIVGGDFNNKKLAEACDKVKLVGDSVENWHRHANGLKTVAFGVDQAHARHITEEFRRNGVEWEYVDASTPDDERVKIWDRLDNGTLMGFSNVAIAGVGFDHPRIACVLCNRPTTSLPLWRQMIARAGRPYPGKKQWILLDHAGNLVRPQLWPYSFFETPPIWTLDGPAKPPKDSEGKARAVSMCKRPVPMPDSGTPESFKGPVSKCGRYLLPCFSYFPAGADVCPFCGLPLLRVGREIEVEAGQLQDLSALREKAKLEVKAKSPGQQAYERKLEEQYLEIYRKAKTTMTSKGVPHKDGYAALQFHATTNRWPRKEWKERAIMLYGGGSARSELMAS
jgi:superfamily II DNA or RNA helicase